MAAEKNRLRAEPDLNFIEDVLASGGESLKKCFQCGTCSVVCNLAPDEHPFPRQEMIWASWGLADQLMKDPNLWLCHQCSDCTAQCPRGAHPGDVLAAIRQKVIAKLAFPAFMGKAVTDPLYWPFLFAFPAAILLGVMLGFRQFRIPEGEIIFGQMMSHLQLNVIFPFFSGLAGLAFLVGVFRLWTGASGQTPLSFLREANWGRMVGAVKDVIVKILVHKDFGECEVNRSRKLAHLLVFYAFLGLLLTTVLAIFVLVFHDYKEYVLQYTGLQLDLGYYPMQITHPVKWLGNASALALIIGCGLMIVNRSRLSGEGKLNSSAYDLFFLYIVFFVGVTGLSSEIFRYAELPLLAYPTYFVHLVLVFSLLIYSPYSKFAHFVYRTVALIYLRYEELGKEKAAESAAEAKAA